MGRRAGRVFRNKEILHGDGEASFHGGVDLSVDLFVNCGINGLGVQWSTEIRIKTFIDGGVDRFGLRSVELFDVRSESSLHDCINDIGVVLELRVSQSCGFSLGTD